MRRLGLISAFCLFSTSIVLSQNKAIVGDSSHRSWSPITPSDMHRLGIVDLIQSPYKSHYRFYNAWQMIDVWSEDNITYQGFVLSFIDRIKRHSRKLITKKEEISEAQAKAIVSIYNDLSIKSIPSQRQIRGWGYGMDGTTYVVEYATPETYSFKDYWEPEEQKMPEGVAINQLFSYLETSIKLRTRYIKFENQLPIGKYNIGMMVMTKTVRFRAKGGSSLFASYH